MILGSLAGMLSEKGLGEHTFNSTASGIEDRYNEVGAKITARLAQNGHNMRDPEIERLTAEWDRLGDKLLSMGRL